MEILEALIRNIVGPITLMLILQMSKLKLPQRATMAGWAIASAIIVIINTMLTRLIPSNSVYLVLAPLFRIIMFVEVLIAARLLTNQQFVRLVFISLSSFIFVYITEVIGITAKWLLDSALASTLVECSLILFGLMAFFRFRSNILRFSDFVDKKVWRLLCLIPLFLLLTFTLLTSFPTSIARSFDNLPTALILCGTSIAIYAVFFYMFNVMRQQNQLEQDLMIKDFQTTTLERSNETAAANIKSFVLFRHDLRHITQMLDNCLDNSDADGARKLVASIDDRAATPLPALKADKLTGNKLVDLTLQYYTEAARAAGIKAAISVGSAAQQFADDSELVVALANSLENSILCCSRLEPSKRYLNISGHQQPRSYFLEIANTFAGELPGDGDTCPFDDDPDAVINWRSVKMFTKRNNIRYRIRVDAEWFSLQFLI